MIGTYETVESKVRAVAERFTTAQYVFMNWSQANVELDSIDKPSIVYVLPPSGDLELSWSKAKDYPLTRIAFLAPTDFDFDGDKNDAVIEKMKRLCVSFIKALNESESFEPIEGRVHYSVVYDYLDRNVTGVMIELDLIEEFGIEMCDDEFLRTGDEIVPDKFEKGTLGVSIGRNAYTFTLTGESGGGFSTKPVFLKAGKKIKYTCVHTSTFGDTMAPYLLKVNTQYKAGESLTKLCRGNTGSYTATEDCSVVFYQRGFCTQEDYSKDTYSIE